MSDTAPINGLAAIASDYDALICDAWGVIHNGRELLNGASEAMIRFRAERGPVVIVTNAPKPSSVIPAQLDRLGLPEEAWDAIVTSGDATRAEIKKRAGLPAWRIGPSFDDPLFEGLAVDFTDPDTAQYIICTGLDDGFNETPDEYRDRLQEAAARSLPMVCANPDIQVNWGGKLMWCAGALGEIYETYGGQVIYAGKPHAPIYALARAALEQAKGTPPNRILAIGDGLATDIKGANEAGLDALLIAGAGGLLEGAGDTNAVLKALKAKELSVVAFMDGLRW